MHTEVATFRRYPGVEIGGRETVDGVDTVSPPFQTDSATFRRFPGDNNGRHEALPPRYPSLTPTLPMPTAGRPISFSPGDAGQNGTAHGDARFTGANGPTPEAAYPPTDPVPLRQFDDEQRGALGIRHRDLCG
eukprot:1063577-Pyramimonas_sp.AAC.1